MLAALLLAGIIAAPLGSIALLLPVRTPAGKAGAWSATRRFVLAIVGTAVLIALVAVVLRLLLGVNQHNLIVGIAGVAAASVAWLPATRQWSARAHLCWATSVFLFVVYLAYALAWTINSDLGPASTVGGVVLWVFELFAAIMSCAYLWEICDALGTEHWRRRITPQTRLSVAEEDLPWISLHVPAHNEPPEMVKQTLRSLLRLDYPRFEIVESPQDYRDWEHARYYRRLYYSYKYFFAVSQPARNEHDGAIFAGTMGLIRRVALEQLGGWDEWCITEDAELSLRLLRAGWHGLHVDQSWGYGIMPLTFEALKGQRYRWCFGGIQILRMHWRSLLPGRVTRGNHLTNAQRWSYLAGGIQWYGDLLGLVFFVFLLAGAFNLATGGGELFRKLTIFLVAAVPVMVGLGLIRAIVLLRRGTGASWRDAIGAFFVWQSTSVVVARASVLGLFARKAAFLRTPKTSERAKWWEALRANWAESSLALLGIAGIAGALTKWNQLSGPLLAALLLFPTLGFAAAPFNSWAAQRATLPAYLRERRRTENRRDRRAFAAGAATGGAVVVAGVVAAAVALMFWPSHQVQSPNLVGPAQGASSAPATPSPSRSATPTPSASSPSPAPTSGSPSPSLSPTPTLTPTPSVTTTPAAPTSPA